MLRGTGHDPDDVLQDVFLRAHAALRSGVVPIEPRAWLMRIVHNAAIDELRRARLRPVGDVELDGVPAVAARLRTRSAERAEARALLGDIHRLPDRQRSVLVLSALDGLTHEEVASRLDTTVDTTRSLLARARENLRRTAAARETSCFAVRDALDSASAAGVRASEIARRHLWTCTECRAHQRDLRGPSRLRRLASWSPWALAAQLLSGGGKVAVSACCALVIGGGAVTVPVVAEYHRSLPPEVVEASNVPVPSLVAAGRAPAAHQADRLPRTHGHGDPGGGASPRHPDRAAGHASDRPAGPSPRRSRGPCGAAPRVAHDPRLQPQQPDRRRARRARRPAARVRDEAARQRGACARAAQGAGGRVPRAGAAGGAGTAAEGARADTHADALAHGDADADP